MGDAIDRMMLSFVFIFRDANSLNGKNRVLRATIALLADAGLLAPEVAVDGVALRHFVVTIALREIHATAVRKFAEQAEQLSAVSSPLPVKAERSSIMDFARLKKRRSERERFS